MIPAAAIELLKRLAPLIACAVLAGLLLVGKHYYDAGQQQIGYDRAAGEYQTKLRAAERTAREKETEWTQQKEEATHAATQRETELRATVRTTAAAADSLRNTISDLRQRLAGDTVDACRVRAAACYDVFGKCAERYREMAERADRHASDVKTLSEAWPE